MSKVKRDACVVEHKNVQNKKTAVRSEPPSGEDGAGERTRTVDSHLGKVALYQLSYARNVGKT